MLIPLALGATSCRRAVFFPTWSYQDSGPLAIVGGVLVERDGCLFLSEGGEEILPVWDEVYAYSGGALVDQHWSVVARVGDHVRGGGGYYADRRFLEEDVIGREIPERCRPEGTEPYALIYDVERGEP
jgi:hypothetical protein